METSERLAAYAAGELAPDEAAALEAALAGDVGLRRELARIRRVDQALESLRDVAPSAAFSAALRDGLRAELAEHAPVHDLAARRRPRWLVPAAGIAAAVAAVVGVAQLGQLGGQDEALTTALAPASGDAAESRIADGAGGAPIYTEGGSYDRESLPMLSSEESILALRDLAGADPAGSQFSFLDLLTSAASGGQRGKEPASDQGPGIAAQDDSSSAAGSAESAEFGPSNPVAACVPTVLDEDRVPLFADLGTFEGRDALVVVLGAPAADGSFSRLEFWVLDPGDCTVLHFAQR